MVIIMLRKISRLFIITTRFEAGAITYALALGAAGRGRHYLTDYPGTGGQLLFLACLGSVMMAAAKIFGCVRLERSAQLMETRNG